MTMNRALLIPALTLLFPVTPSPAADAAVTEHFFEPVDATRERTVPLKVYRPESEQALPVVLFSHGLGGSRDGNPYLGDHWAKAGYVAVFMQHAGSDAEVWKNVEPRERMEALKAAANFEAALNRYIDVPFVIDELERWNANPEHPLHGKLDLAHIGMSGHSFGANTTQGVMGQKFPVNRSFHEPRIAAFIAFSPSLHKRLTAAEAFGEISAPVLLMTGTKDGSPIDPTTTPESRMEVFDGLPAGDKYHLVFEDGEHFAFSDAGGFRNQERIEHHHHAIQILTTRFWDAYLKNDEAAKAALQSDVIREEAKLIAEDVWEWK